MKWPFSKRITETTPSAETESPRDLYLSVMKSSVQPFLKQAGFTRQGSSWYRQRKDIIDVLNFQGSQSNTGERYAFYLNCCLNSLKFQTVTTGIATPNPKYTDCPYRERSSGITGAAQRFEITCDTDREAFTADVLSQLQTILDFYDSFKTTSSFIAMMVDTNLLMSYDLLCKYLAETRNQKLLTTYVTTLHDHFGNEARWPVFAHIITKQIGDVAKTAKLAKLL